jgi:peptidoglycan/LPS O-acetylase OafA/YrhL
VKNSYRPDIDGLRAIAVLAVVIYHAFPEHLRGGFVGVDIFFVISGYLISGIIISDLEAGRFTYLEFYRRRVRRIFPALIIVLFFTLAASWFWLLPDEFREAGLQVIAGATSTANVLFWLQSGYFDPAAATKPLLHLWSLGVEEQFYLIWPLLLVTSYKRRRNLLTPILVITVGSFICNIVTVRAHPSAAFYLPMGRMWELGLGALLAQWAPKMLDRRRVSTPLSLLGMLLIFAAILVIKPSYEYPGWLALIPCAGTAMVIATRDAIPNRILLSRPVMVLTGRISYPLYLWHFVLLTLPRLASGEGLSREWRIAVVVASFILACLTYSIVEKRVRAGRSAWLRPAALVVYLVFTGSAAALAYATDGAAFRYPQNIRPLVDIAYDIDTERYQKQWRERGCFLLDEESFETTESSCMDHSRREGRLIILWGDSHAAALYPGLEELQAHGASFRLAKFTKANCPPVLGTIIDKSPRCMGSNVAVLQRIERLHPGTVIMAAAWTLYLSGVDGRRPLDPSYLAGTVRTMRKAGVERVIVFGNVPEWRIYQPRVSLRLWQRSGAVPERSMAYLDMSVPAVNGRIAAAALGAGAIFISPFDLLCNPSGCLLSAGTKTSVPLAWDNAHLTDAGSILLLRLAAADIY